VEATERVVSEEGLNCGVERRLSVEAELEGDGEGVREGAPLSKWGEDNRDEPLPVVWTRGEGR